MLTKGSILATLDNCDQYESFNFITLEHPYIFTIDGRLNVFRSDDGRWAIASEILGYNPRGSFISLEIRYFGNCLFNLNVEGDRPYNYYTASPLDWDNFQETVDDGEFILPDAKFWLVRGKEVPLSHNLQDYLEAGIGLKEYEPGEIRAEEAGRLLMLKYSDLFRATDEELYKSIPKDLEKVLVIDEWYHKEFHQSQSPYESREVLAMFDLTNPEVNAMVQRELDKDNKRNAELWESRPSGYETWQQIADVIVTGDPSLYKPTLQPNSHWSNWPEAGSL